MTTLFNDTGTIGIIINAVNTNITGSQFLTFLLIIAVILMFFLAFRIPLEASVLLVLPLILTFLAYSNDLYAVGGVVLIYVGVLWAKNWLI